MQDKPQRRQARAKVKIKRCPCFSLGLTLLVLGLSIGASISGVSVPYCEIRSAYAQEDWKKEFEEICSGTDNAMSFTREELKGLIERCDKLKPVIEKLDESTRKVYQRRLRVCRDLLEFVLESK